MSRGNPYDPTRPGADRRRVFTVEEANALLPVMEDVFERMDHLRVAVEEGTETLQILDVLWGDRVLETENPDHEEFVRLRQAIRAAIAKLEEAVRGEILARGIRFPQGGLEQGLLDFPSTLHGRRVFLCWQRGEGQIVAWHEEDTGFGGRRALSGREAVEMGREPGAEPPRPD